MEKQEEEKFSATGCSEESIEPAKRPCYKGNLKQDLKELLHTSWQMILIQVFQLLLGPVAIMFCGHLGDPIQLDGAALAISVIGCTVISVGQGMGTACDTFFAQTATSSNKTMVGIYLQKALIIFSLALLPFYALHINAESLFLVAGQNPEVSRMAAEYLLIFMPGAWCFFAYLICSKYLLCMGILYPNVIISVVSNVVNILLHYVLLHEAGMGTRGSAIAYTSAFVTNFVLTVGFIIVSGCYKDTWKGWTKECLDEWGPMLKLCVSGMLMMCVGWWTFELGLFLSGLLGTAELGAQSIILQIDEVWFQVPLGLEIGGSIIIGQRLGKGDVNSAKSIGWLSLLLSILLSGIPLVLFIGIPRQLTHVFTNLSDVLDLTAKVLPILALYVTLDGIGCVCRGILTGTGRQTLSALMMFTSYYVIALPVGLPLMFLTDLRITGYWIGLTLSILFQFVTLLTIVCRTDWKAQMKEAFERNKTASETDDERILLLDASNKENSTKYASSLQGDAEDIREKVVNVTAGRGYRFVQVGTIFVVLGILSISLFVKFAL